MSVFTIMEQKMTVNRDSILNMHINDQEIDLTLSLI